MIISFFHTTELSWIAALHGSLRTPWLDIFFKGFHYVDSPLFSLFLVSLLWAFYNPKLAIRVLYIVLLSYLTSWFLKWSFALPRPCHIDPSLGLTCPRSFGFPSGAAQSAALMMGIAFCESKRKDIRIIALLFGALLCFSRIYLGVHYFSDILGGLVVGAFLVLIYAKLFPIFEKHAKKDKVGLCLMRGLFVILTPLAIWGSFAHLKPTPILWAILSLSLGLTLCPSRKLEGIPRRFLSSLSKLSCFLGLFSGLAFFEASFYLISEFGSISMAPLRNLTAPAAGFWIGYLFPAIAYRYFMKLK